MQYLSLKMSSICYIFVTCLITIYSVAQNITNTTQPQVDKTEPATKPVTRAIAPTAGTFGTTYIHWGRTVCPPTAIFVYKGYVGTSYFSHGGGSNYLCLPEDPEWPTGASTALQSGSYMYGVEYEHQSSPVWPSSVNNNDAPCAVCRVNRRSLHLMIPAKKTCPTGWTKEYSGFLVAQHYTHTSSDFVCLDGSLETLTGGAANDNGGLFYIVEGICGSLKCPPYINGYELSCVVCTA